MMTVERELLKDLKVRIIYNPDYQIMLEGFREIIERGKILSYDEYCVNSVDDIFTTYPAGFSLENEIVILLGVLDYAKFLDTKQKRALIELANNSKITFAISNGNDIVNITDILEIESKVNSSDYIYIDSIRYSLLDGRYSSFRYYKKFNFLRTGDKDYVESSINKRMTDYMINIISGNVEKHETGLSPLIMNNMNVMDETEFYHIFNSKIINGLSVFFNKNILMSEPVAREFVEGFKDHIHICTGIWQLSDILSFERIVEDDIVVIIGFDRLDFFEFAPYSKSLTILERTRGVVLIPDRLSEVSKPHSENIAVKFDTAMTNKYGKLGVSYFYYQDDTTHELPKIMASEDLSQMYADIINFNKVGIEGERIVCRLDPNVENLELAAIATILHDVQHVQDGPDFQIWQTGTIWPEAVIKVGEEENNEGEN